MNEVRRGCYKAAAGRTGGGEEGPSMKSEEVWDKKEFNDSRQALSPEFCNMTGSTDFTFKMHYLVILKFHVLLSSLPLNHMAVF